MTPAPLISCVTTLYRSAEFVEEFLCRMTATVSSITDNFEIIMVDDGSPDDSLSIAVSLQARYPQLHVIELSRNFGHHAAILAGLTEASGEYVFFVDIDLEEAPEILVDFWPLIEGLDVIFGVHTREGKSSFNRVTGNLFWRLMRSVSKVKIEPNIANVRLMERNYVDALLSMPDRNIFLGGMFAWPGFRQLPVAISRKERKGTSYSILAKLRLAAIAAIGFSHRPLLAVFFLGMFIAAISFIAGSVLLIQKLVDPSSVLSGFTSVMVSLWFLGGLLMGSVGMVGFYVAHIYEQSRARPRFIVRQRYEGDR